jgi:hypothetical protein
MTRLLGRVGRLERIDESCPACGWPDNGVTLEVVEELVTDTGPAPAAGLDDDWRRPCPECGNGPSVVEIVQADDVTPNIGADAFAADRNGIPIARPPAGP